MCIIHRYAYMISAITFVKCLFQTSNLPMDILPLVALLPKLTIKAKDSIFIHPVLRGGRMIWILKEIFVDIYIIYNTHYHIYINLYAYIHHTNILPVWTTLHIPFPNVNCVWFVSETPTFQRGQSPEHLGVHFTVWSLLSKQICRTF